MKNIVIIIGLLVLVLFIGLYAKRKLFDPKVRSANESTTVMQLAGSDEIKKKMTFSLIFSNPETRRGLYCDLFF
jgi:hypothetical protein